MKLLDTKLKPCKFKLAPDKQSQKILSECKEFVEALQEYKLTSLYLKNRSMLDGKILNQVILRHHMGEECCDVMVACLTFLHQNFSNEEINDLFEFVNKKNKKRGYLE